jgi:acyltransferase-like protein
VPPAGHSPRLAESTGTRLAYLDNLKVILVAGVIFGHAWAGYDQLGSWAYSDFRETSIAPLTETTLEILLGPFGLFAMGFFLLIAGMLTPGSLARKGSGRFARDRLVRLGLPLVVFTYLLWPPVVYLLDRVTHRPFRPAWTDPDPVQLWFLEVLLLFSLAYALWHRLPAGPAELRLGHLLGLAALVALASFLVRLRFPLDSTQFADLHLWQWPQYVALFGLGLIGRRPGWLDPVPDRLMRACGYAALCGTFGIAVCAGIVALTGLRPEQFFGGFSWPAALTAAAEGLLAVTVSVCLLGLAQRHLNRPWGTGWASRGAYAAFLVQGHVLVALALLLRPVAVPAEVKGLVVSVLGVLACFGLGWLVVARTPLRRVL